MKRIAFVVHRYGTEMSGGAEYECMVLAEHLGKRFNIDILTSCAKDNSPWDNYYEPGMSQIHGMSVYRFKVENYLINRNDVLQNYNEMSEEEKDWIRSIGPYVPSMMDFLNERKDYYDVIVFFTYSVYTSVAGLTLDLKKKILVPTAHDEPYIHKPIYKNDFRNADGFIFNTAEEGELVKRLFPQEVEGKTECVTCMGFDVKTIREKSTKKVDFDNYVVYTGRVCNGKNYPELNRFFIEYKKRHPSDLKMIVMGTIENELSIVWHDDIKYLGFVSDEIKYSVMKNSKLLLMPSEYESLSIVILESMILGVPVVVNEKCAVLKGQCIRSNAGLYYSNYEEFEKCLEYLFTHQDDYREMSKNGISFVEKCYSWKVVEKEIGGYLEQ